MPFEELKTRQRAVWDSGSYEPIVDLTREVHADLIAALEPAPGETWLDVATGTGAVALLAARAGATVTGIDLAGRLIDAAKAKAKGEGLAVTFEAGDAEALPYEDASFDVVCSAIGTQFAPDHAAVAAELARVCRPGGRLGLACWTPASGVAGMFGVMRPFMPTPPAGVGNVFDWGRAEYAAQMLEGSFELTTSARETVFRGESGEQMWQTFSIHYGPTKTLAAGLDDARREELHGSWVDFYEGHRQGDEIAMPAAWLLIEGVRR